MEKSKFYFWLTAAFLLRLALMPISLHSDLIFVHYFPYFLSYKGIWDIYGAFGDHYLKFRFTYYQPLVYVVIGGFQWLLKPFNPGFGQWMDQVHTLMFTHQTVPLADYFQSFSSFQIRQFVFLMKLPYLVLDAAALWVIAKIMKQSPNKEKIMLLWLFHPVNLFSSYIFGSYRILSALVLWLLIYFVSLGKRRTACLTLGTLCLMDNFPFLFVLPAIGILAKGWRERIEMACWIAFPVVLVLAIFLFHSGCLVLNSYFSPVVVGASITGITRHFSKEVGLIGKLVFLIGYAWLMLFLFKKKGIQGKVGTQRVTDFFVYITTLILLLLFATSRVTVHYWMWLLPLLVYVQSKKDVWSKNLSWALVFLLFLFNLDSRQLNMGLFMPLAPDRMASLPSFHEWADHFVPWGKVVAAARIGFSFLCLFFAWQVYSKGARSVYDD